MWLWVLLLFLLASAAGAVYVSNLIENVEDTLDQVSVGTNEEVPKEQLAKQKSLAILLLGLDSRPETGSLNTDVIMVAALNPDRKTATVVSIPRDTYVKVNGWKGQKANHFYSAAYNRDNLQDTFAKVKEVYGEFLGIPIDYVTVVNFTVLEEIVDALGGIHVEVDQDMRYVDPTDGTDINLRAGPQTLDGKKTLDFVRYRHSNNGETPESSDFERNKRQQRVIAALVDRLKSFDAILKVNEMLKAIGNHVRTDLPQAQIKSLATTYAGMSSDKIRFYPLEGEWRSPYVYLNEAKFEEAKQALREELKQQGAEQAQVLP